MQICEHMLVNNDHLGSCLYELIWSSPLDNIELDIGSSHGEFLCHMAPEFPLTKFVGIEIVKEKCLKAERKIAKLDLKNVYIINMEAYNFVYYYVPCSSIRAVHIFFPSPYPNRDLGLEHRLVTWEFLEKIYIILKQGGILRIVTDHKGYFNDINRALSQNDKWWPNNWIPPSRTFKRGFLVGTYWEKKIKDKPYYNIQVIK